MGLVYFGRKWTVTGQFSGPSGQEVILRQIQKGARKRALVLIVSCVFFIFAAVILMNLEAPPGVTRTTGAAPVYKPAIPESSAPAAPASTASTPTPPAPPPPVETLPAAPVPAAASTVGEADLTALSLKNLVVPVAGVPPEKLRDSFYDGRSEGRIHQALDIMAAKDTPVVAATDGTVMKLYNSDRGGIMIYQTDTSGLYVYYYGHLSRYADGMTEGKQVKRGEVIGYVGDTGNAGAGNYHLHFGISKMAAPGKWSGGEPINPYPLLTGKQSTPSISGSGK
jgi:murein DD-endopeptidase MepM/ murein hydrolase activator NlpD